MTEVTALAAPLAPSSPPKPRPPDPRYRVRFGNARDGRLYGPLPASAASGNHGINGAGSANVTVPGGPLSQKAYRSLPSGKGLVAVEWVDGSVRRVIDAHVVWNRGAGNALALGCSGPLSLLNSRVLVPDVPADQVAAQDVTFSNLDHGSIMRGIVAHLMGMTNGGLPIALEDERAGTRRQTYHGYDLGNAGQRITELTGQQPLTEFLLGARFATGSTTSVVWDLLTGTEAQPQLSNTVPWRLNGTTPGQTLVGEVTVEDTADELATDAWGNGQGGSVTAVIRAATDPTLPGAGWPRMDRVADSNSLTGDDVQAAADGLLAAHRLPANGVKVPVNAAWWWSRGGRVGDKVWLTAYVLAIGLVDLTSRILDVAWDITSQWVVLTLADTIAQVGV